MIELQIALAVFGHDCVVIHHYAALTANIHANTCTYIGSYQLAHRTNQTGQARAYVPPGGYVGRMSGQAVYAWAKADRMGQMWSTRSF